MKNNPKLIRGIKILIIFGAMLLCLPTRAEEIPTDQTTSTPEVVTTSTPETLPPDDIAADTSTPEIVLATTTINLAIATSQETFSFPNLLVTACPETDNSQTYSLNAMCAVKQSGVASDWATYGTDMFLNSINSYSNDWANNIFWNWFADLSYGMTALNKHLLSANENLLLTYDVLPLRIATDSSSPAVDTTSTITLEEFGFEGFNPIWKPALQSTLSINGNPTENETGVYSLAVASIDPISIFGTKTGFVPSSAIILYPTLTTSSTENQTPTDTNTGGGGSGNSTNNQLVSQTSINDAVEKLLKFIKSKQESDGKIVDGGTSDWLAMSFAAQHIYTQDVKSGNTSLYSYIYNYPITELDNELNNCTAYPRHILALLASGVATTDTKITDLKSKLNTCVVNNTFGANGINDDVFGLLAALALNVDQNSTVVQTTMAAIKANQQADGGFAYPGPFESPDLTGVAINALQFAQDKGLIIDPAIFTKAKQYLKSQQLTDGGWGYGASDALTTGWAMMGINALGEGQKEWFTTSGKNPWYILTTLDNDHYTQSWDGSIDWFGTKHAVPALLGKSWPIILAPTNNTQNTADSGSTGGTNPTVSTSTENTSIITPTSTPATTTLMVIPETTTEPENTLLVGEILGEKITNQSLVKSTVIKKQAIATRKAIAPVTENQTSQSETETTSEPTVSAAPSLESRAEESDNHSIAKIILLVSASGTIFIGLYLGIKSLKKK